MRAAPSVAQRGHDLPSSFDAQVVAAIDARLAGVASEHGVRVPWAIESGSRAWGFPSPDSDYDCRFLYVRPIADYLDPWPDRDVIETPLDAVLDVNGWDVVKAVRLAVGGNATVGEWLRSPWHYAADLAFRDELLALVDAAADRDGIVRHYRHLGSDQWARSGAAAGARVPLKKVFYALRPAAVLHWMSSHPGTPPMALGELLEQAPVPPDVADEIDHLVAAKARTRELGTGDVPPRLRSWIAERLEAGVPGDGADATLAERRVDAARRFRALLEEWAPA